MGSELRIIYLTLSYAFIILSQNQYNSKSYGLHESNCTKRDIAIIIQCNWRRKKITDPEAFIIVFWELHLPDSQNTPSNHNNLKSFAKSQIDPSNKFSIPLIIEEEVKKLIANLKENKTTGLDGVTAKLVRLTVPVLTKTVTNICNLSILTGYFPSLWEQIS